MNETSGRLSVIEREAQSTLNSLEIRKHGRVVWTLAVMLSGVGTQHAFAQGGPPLVGDDPETPGPGTWEIDLAVTMSHGPGETDWALPDVDINYGWGDRIQLKFDTPYALTHDHGVSSGLGPSLFGAKWRFVGDSESGFAMSIYPQWMSHLVRSSVDRGLADPGSQWFVPIEMEIKLGEGQLDLEAGRRLESGGPRTWEVGLIGAHDCVRGLECLVELRETGISDQSKTLVNLGTRWKLSSALSLLTSLGHEFGPARADPRNIVLYVGAQVRNR
jgi:hypothetical protein